MYKFLELHGNTMRFSPYRTESGLVPNKVVKIECIKQIQFIYKESNKREYITLTLGFDDENKLILPSENKEAVNTITEKYRRNRPHNRHWDDDVTEYTIENSWKYKDSPEEIRSITKESNKELWEMANNSARKSVICDVSGVIEITFLNEADIALGVRSVQHNINEVESRELTNKINELYAEVYADIDLFFGVSTPPNTECYVKDEDEDVGTNSERVNILWPIVR